MKNLAVLLTVLFFSSPSFAQGVKVSTSAGAPDASAIFEMQSNTQGFLPPRMTTSERDQIISPAEGLIIVNTSTGCLNMFFGGAWKKSCFECDLGMLNITANTPLCEGEDLNLSVTTVPEATYLWEGPNGYSSTESDPVITDTEIADAGSYSVTVTKAGCSADPLGVNVVINDSPEQPIASSNSPIIVNNTIELNASEVPGATYEWSGPSGFSSGQQNPSISNATEENEGTYYVYAMAANNCASAASSVDVSIINKFFFEYTGSDQSFLVPLGITSIDVKLWGAAGSGSTQASYGGSGGYAGATIAVTPGETLTLIVGQGGQISGTSPVFGGGGSGDTVRGSGGGRSAIRRSGTELITAGGGGAAGGGGGANTRDGGAGGGESGQGGFGSNPGGGGTQSSGGIGGSCPGTNDGTQFNGANGLAGGGGGYFGGGSGGDCGCCSGSAGGGSGYVGGAGLSNANNTGGTGTTPGNSSDPDRNGAGQGGAGNGANGRIVIYW